LTNQGISQCVARGSYHLTKEARETFLRYNEQNQQRMSFEEDLW